MPMTSTKNFRLSSGFGVSNSMWPRWARSKIGSGVIGSLSRRDGQSAAYPPVQATWWARRYAPLPTLQLQRPRHVVEQLVHAERARNELLLRGVSDNQLQRSPHLVRAKTRRSG